MMLDFRCRIWSLATGICLACREAAGLLGICFLLFGFCVSNPDLSVDSKSASPRVWIIGKWKMITVLEGNQDITPMLNPENDRWIEFKADGTFKSGGSLYEYGDNAGRYMVDNNAKTLHLDSDAGEGDDSNWHVQFREDLLYMKGIGSNRQEMTTVISQRVLE